MDAEQFTVVVAYGSTTVALLVAILIAQVGRK